MEPGLSALRIEDFLMFGPSDSYLNFNSSFVHRGPSHSHSSGSVNGNGNGSGSGDESGESGSLRMEAVHQIKRQAEAFVDSYRHSVERSQALLADCKAKRHALERQLNDLQADKVMACYHNYVKRDVKIRLLRLAKMMTALEHFESIQEIPQIVVAIMDSKPIALPSNTRLKQRLHQLVERLSKRIMSDFHGALEMQLVEATSFQENDVVRDHHHHHHRTTSNLNDFFEISRQWLLGYSLIALLPHALSDARKQCLDRYPEVLDEALTPLWGRFHYHLTAARDSLSSDQLLWTFNYAKSFIELMVDLCAQMTQTDTLNRFYPGDYRGLGDRYIAEKAVRFLRSHLAHVLEDLASLADKEFAREMMICIIENALEFDQFLKTLAPSSSSNSSGGTLAESGSGSSSNAEEGGKVVSLRLSSVIFEIKDAQAAWIDADYFFFKARVLEVCSSPQNKVYASQFGLNAINFGTSIEDLRRDFSPAYSGLRCYRGLYECLNLLHVACQRYADLPPLMQDMFSEAVLEPLLLSSIAVLLFRIRSNETLFHLSVRRLPAATASSSSSAIGSGSDSSEAAAAGETDASASASTLLGKPTSEVFAILSEFTASAQYFQSSLSNLEAYHGIALRNWPIRTLSRFEEHWAMVQLAVPKDWIFLSASAQRKYSLATMIQAAFAIESKVIPATTLPEFLKQSRLESSSSSSSSAASSSMATSSSSSSTATLGSGSGSGSAAASSSSSATMGTEASPHPSEAAVLSTSLGHRLLRSRKGLAPGGFGATLGDILELSIAQANALGVILENKFATLQ